MTPLEACSHASTDMSGRRLSSMKSCSISRDEGMVSFASNFEEETHFMSINITAKLQVGRERQKMPADFLLVDILSYCVVNLLRNIR